MNQKGFTQLYFFLGFLGLIIVSGVAYLTLSSCSNPITGKGISLLEALNIARNSECTKAGTLLPFGYCNNFVGVWRIAMTPKDRKCNLNCVVNPETKQAETGWMCMGLVP